MVLGCTCQIIGAAIFYRFGQPMHRRAEHRRLPALPAKIGRSGRENGFEQGVDVADTNIFTCDRDETPPDCVAIKCVNCARSPLRQLNLAPTYCFLKNARRNPPITLQWSIDDAV